MPMNNRRTDGPYRGNREEGRARPVWLLVAVLLLIGGAFCTTGAAASLSVGEDGYTTIAEALDAAVPGDTITVASGTYFESLTVSVPVTITGTDTGEGLPVIVATKGEAALILEGGETTVEGLIITGTVPCGVFVHSDRTIITGTTIATTVPGTSVGICIYDADRTLVMGNRIEGQRIGIQISESDGTEVYYNELAAITGAVSTSPETTWTSPVITYQYDGTTFEGQVGNSWSGYAGTDPDGNGIGDEAYVVPSFSGAQFGPGGTEGGTYPFDRRPLDLMGELTGAVTIEDPAPLIAGIDAYTVTSAPQIPGEEQGPGQRPRVDGTNSPFTFPGEPRNLLWPAVAFLASLGIAGALTVADRRTRHRSVLNRRGSAVLILTAGYTILAVLCSSAIFVTGFQALMVLGVMPGINPLVAGLAFISMVAVFLAVSIATERTPRYLLHAYLIAAGIVAAASASLLLTGRAGTGPGVPLSLGLAVDAIALGLYHRSRIVTPGVSGDTDERTRIAHEGDPFDETRIMDTQLRDVYFPATLADRYRDVTFIGKGGIARVFRAVRRSDGAVVAVKVPISFDETTGRIFLKEMKLWEGLVHPNIVRLCSVNILPVPFVEMEYVARSLAGVTLPLPPEEAAAIVTDIVRGLAYAHGHGIIHRDIKPQNILLAEDGSARITDWGLGTVMGDGHESSIVGFSVQYAAPEQIAPRRFGDADTRTDIYQTGVVFYELLTGRRPFADGGLGEMTDAILVETPPPPSSFVSAAAPWDDIVMRCLAKEKEGRFPSAAALEEALAGIAGHR
ncbi:MAG TPA: DUF1565 domain-containing protein [Methanoculleus sp.]|nr:DUF1565 domain-containing protein [Methanoculleus sp.]